MKTNRLTAPLLSTFVALVLQQAVAQPLNLHQLTNDVYTQTFDGLLLSTNPWTLGTLPGEWSCYLNVTPSSPGTIAPFTNNFDSWDYAFTGDFKNFAGVFDYIGGTNFDGTESREVQTNAPNRCLGIRQTGSFGDPGVSFVLKLTDTANLHNFALSADFLNLDPTSPRQTTWTVEYGWADAFFGIPLNFFPIATYTNVPGTFNSYHTNIALPDGTINNFNGQVWIRISALTTSENSGNRESFAIDNIGLTWTNGTGGCTRIHVNGNPANTTVYSNATATLTVAATGTPPYYYQWFKDNAALSDGGNIFGSQQSQLQVRNTTTSDQGTYTCVVSNACDTTGFIETSHGATLTVTDAPPVSIAYLRTLVNPNTFAATNTTLMFRTTGLITTAANITSGNTASYYLQDGTGGINLFVTGGSSFRPNMGDVVTAVGFLSSFRGGLELVADLRGTVGALNATLVQILSNNIAAYPTPKLLSWDNLGVAPTNADLNYNWAGSVVLLTNVYFGTNAGLVTPPPGSRADRFPWVTNSSGKYTQIAVYSGQVNDLTNRTLPSFAYWIQGVLIPFTTNAAGTVPTTGSYEVGITRWVDVATNPLSLSITRTNSDSTLSWFASPYTMRYTILGASDVTGPYLPLAAGFSFTNTAGTYTDSATTGDQKFYRLTSP
jgi:Immunoglobulin domain